MKFQPKTEEEVQTANLLEAGDYPAEVTGAEEKISKKGNAMIVLQVKVHASEKRMLTDYLLDLESTAYKLRHFCVSAGIEDKYTSGELTAADCVGKAITVKVGIDKNEGTDFPAKNVILDYPVAVEASSPPDDDLPF